MIRDGWIPDATQINDFRRCPELFRLRHIKGLTRRVREEAPAAGEGWHAAMKLWFDDAGYEVALHELRKHWPDSMVEGEHEKRPLSLFERLLEAYCKKYPRGDDPFEVVRNEKYVEGVIDNVSLPFQYCGIIDRKLKMGEQEYVCDAKSTSLWLNNDYFASYDLNQQQMGYCALELVNDRPCSGYYIDAVHVDTRYHKVKDSDFQRYGPVTVPNRKLDQWAKDTESAIHQIEWFWNVHGPDSPWEHREQGCRAWNKWCGFWSSAMRQEFPGLCRQPVEMHESLMGEYDVAYWNPREKAES